MSAPLGTLTPDPAAAHDLRAALAASGYDADGLAEPVRLRSLAGGAGPMVDWREISAGDEPLTALAELFVFGRAIDAARARAALAPLALDDALAAGFVEPAGDDIVSPWEIVPAEGLLLLADHPDRMTPANSDFVGTVSNSARTLAYHTLRAPVQDTLDLGTGSGIQALLAARHSGRVLGVDLNPRAATIAAVNAELNDTSNAEWAIGDWFEAVPADHGFGLVVANLPFIAAPEVVYQFAHGGLDTNELSRRLVRGAAARIGTGGTAQILTSWTRRADEDRMAPVADFVAGTGCDAVVLIHGVEDAAAYAAEQCSWLAPGDRPRYGELLRRWLRFYREAGAELIDYGLISLRHSAGATPWLRDIDVPRALSSQRGEHVDALFAGNAEVAALRDDDELLAGRYALVEGHRVTQASHREADGYHQEPTTIAREPDVGYDAQVSVYATAVLFSMGAHETLAETVARVAADAGLDEPVLRSEAVAAVKLVLQRGLATSRLV